MARPDVDKPAPDTKKTGGGNKNWGEMMSGAGAMDRTPHRPEPDMKRPPKMSGDGLGKMASGMKGEKLMRPTPESKVNKGNM